MKNLWAISANLTADSAFVKSDINCLNNISRELKKKMEQLNWRQIVEQKRCEFTTLLRGSDVLAPPIEWNRFCPVCNMLSLSQAYWDD